MANKEISELTSKTTPVRTDEIEIQETGGGNSRKTTLADVVDDVWGVSGQDQTLANGNLVVGTSGKGIDFSATSDGTGTASSEVFGDYEEGTWTPDFAWGGTDDSYTLSESVGTYTKIGNIVFFDVYMTVGSGSSGTGALTVTGLPYTSKDTGSVASYRNWQGSAYFNTGLTITASENVVCTVDKASTVIAIMIWSSATYGPLAFTDSELSGAIGSFSCSGWYRV